MSPATIPPKSALALGWPAIEAGATRTTRHCLKTRHTRGHQRTSGSGLPSFDRLSPVCEAKS